jgi:prevent-host-death family protein
MSAECSVYEAKAKLSEILRLVKADREVTITERGKRIAKIVPYASAEEPAFEERIDLLRERGQVKTASASPASVIVPGSKGSGALKRFLEDRS